MFYSVLPIPAAPWVVIGAVLVAPAAAQVGMPVSAPHAQLHTGAFGATYVLDVNGDGRRDVLTRLGDQPIVLSAPSIEQTSTPIRGVEASVVAVLPEGATDAVLSATQAGIMRHRYSRTAAAGRPGFDTDAVVDATAASSRALVVYDLDGDGHLDLAGLTADGAGLWVAVGGANGSFGAPVVHALGAPATRLVALEWFGAAAFVLVRGAGVELVTPAGLPLDGFQFTGTVADVTPLREAATSGEVLAVLTTLPGGANRLHVLRPGASLEGPIELGAFDAVALTAGDVDGSGDDDLLVTARGDGYLRVYWHGGPGGPTYTALGVTAHEVCVETLDPSGQRANAVAADFDRDGDIDLFQLVEAVRGGVLLRSIAQEHSLFTPDVNFCQVEFDGPSPHALLDCQVSPLLNGLLPTHLEVELWAEVASGASYFPSGPCSFLLGSTSVAVDPNDPHQFVRVDATVPMGSRAWVQMRGVDRSSPTKVIGVDRVVGVERTQAEGGGNGGGDTGQKGDGADPPPADIPPFPGGG